ncbi:MAG: hypothetical protein H9917_01415 [Candidatus Oceanisphaera merdipullorum]|nr:hypothetical protein [Candidatus Oceanisphaera merdipullorum]
MFNKDPWLLRIAIGLDQLLNALLGGDIDETLSSRTYRRARGGSKAWQRLELIINRLFFWQTQHCRASYLDERQRRQRWLALYDDKT